MYRKKHGIGRRFASVVLAAAMIVTAVPAQAADFCSPDSFEQIFSSGEEDSVDEFDTGTQQSGSRRLHRR